MRTFLFVSFGMMESVFSLVLYDDVCISASCSAVVCIFVCVGRAFQVFVLNLTQIAQGVDTKASEKI